MTEKEYEITKKYNELVDKYNEQVTQLVVEKKKNALLMEQLKNLKDGIVEVYNSMMSLDKIYDLEVDILEHEDIEEI